MVPERNVGQGPQTISGYWLQRVIPAVGLTLGTHVRLYSSFQYEKEMGNNAGPRPNIDEDQGDFHEAFVDLSTGLDDRGRSRCAWANRKSSTAPEDSWTITRV